MNAWAAYDVFFIAFLAAVLGGERPLPLCRWGKMGDYLEIVPRKIIDR